MSKFDFIKEVKLASENPSKKQDSLTNPAKTSQVVAKKTQFQNKVVSQEDPKGLSVQVSLPTGQKKQAKRNQRQMTIHEDVYQAAAEYAKKEGMSVSRLFETVMAQALKVEVD